MSDTIVEDPPVLSRNAQENGVSTSHGAFGGRSPGQVLADAVHSFLVTLGHREEKGSKERYNMAVNSGRDLIIRYLKDGVENLKPAHQRPHLIAPFYFNAKDFPLDTIFLYKARIQSKTDTLVNGPAILTKGKIPDLIREAGEALGNNENQDEEGIGVITKFPDSEEHVLIAFSHPAIFDPEEDEKSSIKITPEEMIDERLNPDVIKTLQLGIPHHNEMPFLGSEFHLIKTYNDFEVIGQLKKGKDLQYISHYS